MFADLTATCDTVWHCGLTCKLLRWLADRHMVHMIMETVGNRSFTLTTGNVKRVFCEHFHINFAQIFTDFARIFDKSKILGARLHILHHRLIQPLLARRAFKSGLNAPCRTFPLLLTQMGYGAFCDVRVAQKNKPSTKLSSNV